MERGECIGQGLSRDELHEQPSLFLAGWASAIHDRNIAFIVEACQRLPHQPHHYGLALYAYFLIEHGFRVGDSHDQLRRLPREWRDNGASLGDRGVSWCGTGHERIRFTSEFFPPPIAAKDSILSCASGVCSRTQLQLKPRHSRPYHTRLA